MRWQQAQNFRVPVRAAMPSSRAAHPIETAFHQWRPSAHQPSGLVDIAGERGDTVLEHVDERAETLRTGPCAYEDDSRRRGGEIACHAAAVRRRNARTPGETLKTR